ncbi:MAG: LacI family transcriptional regulator [Anaerolineaceae bacterium]|nr:MAG: LacI family transcriptional regulator [Anaerolineaceae bacterium]
MKKVTIQDVARELNLSRNTVAKALNNSDTVSYETRYIVIEKAYEMGYSKLSPVVLNEFKLRNKIDETKTIVVLNRREISVFWNSIIMGISDELNTYGCKLQFNFISEHDEKNLILPLDLQADISGIIILSVFSKDYIDQIMKYNIPIVFLDAPCQVKEIAPYGDIVICESKDSINTITSSLIKKGMTKIGFIGDITYCKTIYDRYQGYLSALQEAGIVPDERIIATYHANTKFYKPEEVEAALLEFPYMPEAIVCANDDIALYVIRHLNSKGISVPNDVAVTGYDNAEEMAKVEPFLTTVRVGNQRLGRRLVQQLMWRLKNPNFPKEVIFVGVEVIFRESSNTPICTDSNG